MRKLMFSTKEESLTLTTSLGGKLFNYAPGTKAVGELLNYLDSDENAIAIIVGDPLLMGWSTPYPAEVEFSEKYPADPRAREQALGRVRGIAAETKGSEAQ